MSYFTSGGPGKEHGTNKPPPTERIWERSKGDTKCPTTSQNPSRWHPSWLNNACPPGRTLSQNDWLRVTVIKPETSSHMAEQFSWVPLPSCSPPRRPFPIKSLALSTHVSPQTIHFQVLVEPTFGPWKGVPFPATFLCHLLLLLLSHFSCVWLCATPWTAAHQALPSLGFSRREYWNGLTFPSPMHESEKWKWSSSVVSDSQQPHGLQPTGLLRPWDFPGKSTGVGCHRLLCYATYTLSIPSNSPAQILSPNSLFSETLPTPLSFELVTLKLSLLRIQVPNP